MTKQLIQIISAEELETYLNMSTEKLGDELVIDFEESGTIKKPNLKKTIVELFTEFLKERKIKIDPLAIEYLSGVLINLDTLMAKEDFEDLFPEGYKDNKGSLSSLYAAAGLHKTRSRKIETYTFVAERSLVDSGYFRLRVGTHYQHFQSLSSLAYKSLSANLGNPLYEEVSKKTIPISDALHSMSTRCSNYQNRGILNLIFRFNQKQDPIIKKTLASNGIDTDKIRYMKE